jgi:hypothetical protein
MWQEGVFTFDANVLLNIYRYTPETRERFFEVLHRLKDRIWVSHQAAHEYHKHRLDEISSQFRVFDDIEKHLNASLNELETNHRRHPFGIDVNPLTKIIKNAIKRAKPVLQEVNSKYHNLLASDPFRETIVELFDGKVGEPYSKEGLDKIHKKAEERFKQESPPGYKDKTKGGTEQYGDVVLWFQLLDQAKSQKKPIIFITDDGKEDWWLKHKGKTIGPRPELIQEMSSEASVSFHMYSSEQFMIYAQNFLDFQDNQAATVVEEVREIRQQDEVYQQIREALLHRQSTLKVPGIDLDAIRVNLDAMPRINLDAIQRELEAYRIKLDAIPRMNLDDIRVNLDAIPRMNLDGIRVNLDTMPRINLDAIQRGLEAYRINSDLDQRGEKDHGDEAEPALDQETDRNDQGEENKLTDE